MPPSRARSLLYADLALGLGAVPAAEVAEALRESWESGESLVERLVARGTLDDDARAKIDQALEDLLAQAGGDADLALARRGGIDESIHLGLPGAVSRDVADAGAPARPPLRTVAHGRYREFKLISRGGMGLVYSVLDTELNRRVAFKMVLPEPRAPRDTPPPAAPLEATPPPDGDADSARSFDELRVRFLQEAWITGAMEHPGVVPVYELGQTRSGIPYYTMRYLAGERTLKQALTEADGLDGRLLLLEPFLKILDTIRYAHARGVVHRDLKPENIVIGDFGEVIVLDWGLSKMEGRPDISGHVWQGRIDEFRRAADLHTVAGALGTPGYMAPEAVTGQGERVGRASDVYSLGVMLWELLTGKLPYAFTTFLEFVQAMMDEDPPPAAEVVPEVPDELSAIAMRALCRDPAERYASVDEMATALRHWLSEGTVERRVQAMLTEARAAFEASRRLEGNAQFWQLDRAARLCSQVLMLRPGQSAALALQGEIAARRSSGIRARVEGGRRDTLKRAGVVVLALAALAALFVANVLSDERHEAQLRVDAVLADLGAVQASLAHAERERRAADARLGAAYAATALGELRAGYTADAQLLAAAGAVVRADATTLGALARTLRAPGPRLVRVLPGLEARALAFAEEGQSLVVARSDGNIALVSLAADVREELGALPEGASTGEPTCVAMAPDGTRLAVGTNTGRVFVVDPSAPADDPSRVASAGSPPESSPVTDLAWLPNGAMVWSGHVSGSLLGWRARECSENSVPSLLRAHDGSVTCLRIEPKRGVLWSADEFGTVRSNELLKSSSSSADSSLAAPVLDMQVTLTDDGSSVRTCATAVETLEWDSWGFARMKVCDLSPERRTFARFLPQPEILATVTDEGALEIWDLTLGRLRASVRGDAGAPRCCAAHRESGLLAIAGSDGATRVWEVRCAPASPPRPPACVLGPDEGVLRITPDLHLERRNADGTPRETLGEALEAPVTALACDVASRRAVTTDLGGTLTLWDAETCAQLHRRDVGDAVPTAVALFPGGEKVAYGTLAGDLATWSTNTPRPVTMQGTRGSTVTALAIDANAEVVVAGFADGAVEVWSLERREKIDSIEGVGPSPTCVAAGAGGATVAWYTTDDRLFVWEAAEGRIVALGRPARGASALAVELRDDGSVHALLLDGRRIAVAPDGSITSDGETTLAVALSGAGPSWILRSPIAQLIELETRYGMMVEGLRVRLADAERIQANQPRIAPWSDLR